jgi:hypothetical protein
MSVDARQVTRRSAVSGPLLLAGTAVAGVLALRLRDPHEVGSWGTCPLLHLTGLYCPGCGGLRAVDDLARLDVGAALSSNALLVLLLPLVVAAWAAWLRRSWRHPGSTTTPHAPAVADGRVRSRSLVLAVLAVTVVFAVVRNLPAGGWLAP